MVQKIEKEKQDQELQHGWPHLEFKTYNFNIYHTREFSNFCSGILVAVAQPNKIAVVFAVSFRRHHSALHNSCVIIDSENLATPDLVFVGLVLKIDTSCAHKLTAITGLIEARFKHVFTGNLSIDEEAENLLRFAASAYNMLENSYKYIYDGVDNRSIEDGGMDMYDVGNKVFLNMTKPEHNKECKETVLGTTCLFAALREVKRIRLSTSDLQSKFKVSASLYSCGQWMKTLVGAFRLLT